MLTHFPPPCVSARAAAWRRAAQAGQRLAVVALLGGSLLLRATAAQAQAASPPAGTPGLLVDYYRGYFNGDTLYFTATPPAIRDRAVEQLNFPLAATDNFGVGSVATYHSPGNPDEFSGRFRGQVNVLTPGQYTFYLGSDDAAYLWLDHGAQPLAFNAGDQRGYREATGTCTLTAGLHTLLVAYGEHGGSQGLVLRYDGPGMPKQLVPNGVFYGEYATAVRPALNQLDLVPDPARQQIAVRWTTTAEEHSLAFVVQKSTDGVVFQDLGRQASTQPSLTPHQYEVLDQRPANGQNFYRLQQWRSDRSPVYSPIKAVDFKVVPFAISVYPVPNNGTFFLAAQPTSLGPARLELLDMSGRLLYRQQLDLLGGAPQRIQPGMATGLYLLELETELGLFRQKISLGY